MLRMRILAIGFVISLLPLLTEAQITTGGMNGTVKNDKGEPLAGANINATHLPTGTSYSTISRKGGQFDIPNMMPGGPYKVTCTFVGFQDFVREDIFITLGEASRQDFSLAEQAKELTGVVITASRRVPEGAKGGIESNVGRDKMANLPTVGRNISDYLRFVPGAKIGSADGSISLAGQNNRYNSFYIDGAVNNDVFGLAASGTNGGQAGIAPISIDAVDQFQVVLSPYDASLGNFTGGGINAITRSGTNTYSGSVYYFFRNENLSGKTPGVAKSAATKLADFSNKTYGFRVGGPIIKNKMFFFLNGEVQRDERPQPFDFSTYSGSLTQSALDGLRQYLITQYKYDPGGYIDNPEKVQADRIVGRIDWNLSPKNKLSVSYRYNKGLRYNTSRSSNSTINFYNNGFLFPTTTHSGSFELNSKLSQNANNKLLLTFTNVKDDRGPLGDAFPRVQINDGAQRVFFGTEEFSTGNLLKQKNYALFDVFKFYAGKNIISIGTDNELSDSYNIFVRQNFGSYQFNDLNTFLTGGTAGTYNRSYSLVDSKVTGDGAENAAAKFKTLRLGFFINDEIKVSDKLTLNFGLRADKTVFLTTPTTDKFFNDTAVAAISRYYDLRGARSGQKTEINWSINPRFGFIYKMDDENLTIRGGAGFFTGRIPLVWPGGVYNNNGVSLAGINRSNVAFRADPFNQYELSDFGLSPTPPSGQIDLMAKEFKMTKVFRTSLAFDKNFGQGWRASFETYVTKNINEIAYEFVNILPPTQKSVGADARNVYDLSGSFTRPIPMRANGSNPYTGVYLLYNNEGKKGHSFGFNFTVDKAWRNGFAFNANYAYGYSRVLNEGTSSQNNSQWRFMEEVNGRNFLQLSRSDYDLGHRITAFVAKKITYANKVLATTISLFYTGQSGSPFSYVMSRGMVRDLDNNEDNDLIYVPRNSSEIIFLQNGSLSPADQWNLFDAFIEKDKYLRKRRGQYAERNGARLPFSNIIDLKIQQDFNIRFGKKTYQIQVTYDVFNFTNMINRNWGKQYFATNDNFRLLAFQSYASATNLTPRFTFTPPTGGLPYTISDGVFNSARWSSQLGFRLNF